MKRMAKVLGRLLAVLVDKGVINGDDALLVLAPLNEGEDDEEAQKRKFIRIITEYHSDEHVTYKEFRGKPYFSIMFEENGETFVGFGTYKIDVLSRYLRDYFIDAR